MVVMLNGAGDVIERLGDVGRQAGDPGDCSQSQDGRNQHKFEQVLTRFLAR